MPSSTARKRVEQAETDIAVLQTQFRNMEDNFDELKLEIRESNIRQDKYASETKQLINNLQLSNKAQHEELAAKIAGIEKIKWMLLGAAAVIGATGAEAFKMFVSHLF